MLACYGTSTNTVMPAGLQSLRKHSLSTPFNSVIEPADADEFKYYEDSRTMKKYKNKKHNFTACPR